MTEEIGLAQPVEYTEAERRTIATHEAGHATVAWLVGKGRKLEVLSIIKRKDALGLLAHSEDEERFTKTRPRSRPSSRSPSGAWWPRSCSSARRAPGWPATSRPPRQHACQMVGPSAWASTLISVGGPRVRRPATSSPRSLSDRRRPRRGRGAAARRPRTRCRTMLDEHRNVVEALRDALLERDELVGDEILDVIRASQPTAAGSAAGDGDLVGEGRRIALDIAPPSG